jgi:hypothetical protein
LWLEDEVTLGVDYRDTAAPEDLDPRTDEGVTLRGEQPPLEGDRRDGE